MIAKIFIAYNSNHRHSTEDTMIFERFPIFEKGTGNIIIDWRVVRNLFADLDSIYVRECREDGTIKGYHKLGLIEQAIEQFPQLLDTYWQTNIHRLRAEIKALHESRA